MKKIILLGLLPFLILSGDIWAEQAGEGQKASPMQGMTQEMMKGEKGGEGGMGGMMGMMKIMQQCSAMMEQCCTNSESTKSKEVQNK